MPAKIAKKAKVHRRFIYQYRGGSIKTEVVTPPKDVYEGDTIRLSFLKGRKPWGIYLTADEAVAAAGLLSHAIWYEGKRAKRWPKR